MILEIIIIIITIFIITLAFYKQTNAEYKILQIEQGDLGKVTGLIADLSPIVIRDCKTPNLWTNADVMARPRLQQIPLIYKGFEPITLIDAVTNDALILPTTTSATAEVLASECGLQVWAEHVILSIFDPLWYSRLLQIRTKAVLGSQGLRETVALLTFIMPTEEDLQISLLHRKQFSFCPDAWEGTVPAEWTKATTPLVGEIQFIDVIVRKGSMLVLPPHWRWAANSSSDNRAKKPMICIMEIHHPVSIIAEWIRT